MSRSGESSGTRRVKAAGETAQKGRPYHHGQLREALLNSAFELLAGQPARQISLREIARHAGVSHAAPYHYFPDRQQLLGALAERCVSAFYEAQRRAAEEAGADPGAQLLALGGAYIDFAVQQTHAFQLIYDPEVCRPGQESVVHQANHQLLLQTAQRCVAQGLLPDSPPEVLAAGLWSTVHGLANLILLGHLPLAVAQPALQTLIGLNAGPLGEAVPERA